MSLTKQANSNYAEFLLELNEDNIPLSSEQEMFLKDSGFLKNPYDKKIGKKRDPKPHKKYKTFVDFTIATPKEVKTDKRTAIVTEEQDIPEVITEDEVEETFGKLEGMLRRGGEIRKKDWTPDSIVNHRKDFVDWIESINTGFSKRKSYDKFTLYCEQSVEWYKENRNINDLNTQQEQTDYALEEFRRCRENSLYAVSKYGYLQESSLEYGRRKYVAGDDYEHHKIICYLFDCNYSVIMGKPRQIGSTSILGLISVFKIILNRNYFLKFITEDQTTGQEIFEDKIKFPFSELPYWFKPNILNDRGNLFKIGNKAKKGGDKGINSKIEVVAPTRTAINGGSPQCVFIDEIGSIPILTDMVNEGRPTMFIKDPITHKLRQNRMIWLWGTGTTGKGGGAYEKEWSRIEGLWKQRKFESGIVPLFFDWTTRCTQDEYLKEKDYYYGARSLDDNTDSETSRIQFHQHYPSTPRDMFMLTDKILVSREFIDKNITKIRDMDEDKRSIYGRFVPIYNHNKPVDNQDVPYEIIGANFEPINDGEEELATAIMLLKPDPKWTNRYFQGTDPISSDTGTSNMASAIWDKKFNTIACLMDYREPSNPKASFLQTLLMGLYYDCHNNGGVKELLEKNIGLAYRNYKENKGFLNSLVLNSEIEDSLQSGTASDIGIDNKGVRNEYIIARMGEMFKTFGDNIYIGLLFQQLITFVCKTTRTGKPSWQPLDNRYYYDDALFAAVFAYICSVSFYSHIPKNLEETEDLNKNRGFKMEYDSNYKLIQVRG